MIRPTIPEDTPALEAIAASTDVFKPSELVALREVLDDYHDFEHEAGHPCVTLEQYGRPAGFAYYAPAAMTDNTWYLYWIAVDRTIQAKGLGTRLIEAAAEWATEQGAAAVELSVTTNNQAAATLYTRAGFAETGRRRPLPGDPSRTEVFLRRVSPARPPGR